MKSWLVAGLSCFVADVTLGSALLSRAIASNTTSPTHANPALPASQQMTASLSPCAMGCIATEVARSTCNATDFACICTNQQLNPAIGACLAQNCTVVESLQAQNYSKTSCGVPVRRNTDQAPISWTLFALAFVAVAARLLSKLPSLNPAFHFGLDDWAILAAMIALIPSDIGSQTLVGLGLGKDICLLAGVQYSAITNPTLKLFFVEELLYAFVVAVTKLSILLFYLRLFNEPWFRMFCYVMLGLTTAYGLGQMLVIALICTPVSYNWTRWDGQHSGQCGNVTIMTFFNGGINIALDFVLFVLPVTQFINVSWTLKKKIGVSLIFLVGLFVTICSGVRLATVARFGDTQNPTCKDTLLLQCSSWIDSHNVSL
ncbi:cfem domain-containing protein [Colletotrichum incanum]|uniref:Cfem domain-containing protein n=1 Tax=Colletotrichum incanum TaxID=1573173 RepID=A0A167CDY2_COLIC|nr:cfem domain-containing protein [Colletotrichum incanum]